MKDKVKVAIWGFGAMGSGIAKVLLRKQGVDIVGVCDLAPQKVGKSIYELLEVAQEERPQVLVSKDIEEVLQTKPHVCILATDSFTIKAFPKRLSAICGGSFVLELGLVALRSVAGRLLGRASLVGGVLNKFVCLVHLAPAMGTTHIVHEILNALCRYARHSALL